MSAHHLWVLLLPTSKTSDLNNAKLMVLKTLLVGITLSIFESLQASTKPNYLLQRPQYLHYRQILELSFISARKVIAGKVRKALYLEAFLN